MASGQVITLDTAYGSATVSRFFRSSAYPELNAGFALTIIINAGQDIVLPAPYVAAIGEAPVGVVDTGFAYLLLEGPPGEPAFRLFLENQDGSLVLETSSPIIGPVGPQPLGLVTPVPEVIVLRPDGQSFTYIADIIGQIPDQGRHDISTPVGIIEAMTLCRAVMPATDLDQGGLYSAFLQFGTVATAFAYFQVKGGIPTPPPVVPGAPDFFAPDFDPSDFQTSS